MKNTMSISPAWSANQKKSTTKREEPQKIGPLPLLQDPFTSKTRREDI